MFEGLISFWDRTTLYLSRIVYYVIFGVSVLFMLSYIVPELFVAAIVVLIFASISVLLDFYLLYREKNGVEAERFLVERLSNGDDNKITIRIQNRYDYRIFCTIIDELPFQLQERNWKLELQIDAHSENIQDYFIKPQERGEYNFGNINVYVDGPLKLVRRRYIFHQERNVKVYPSYVQMRKYQLHAIAAHLQETGVKRMRRLGHS